MSNTSAVAVPAATPDQAMLLPQIPLPGMAALNNTGVQFSLTLMSDPAFMGAVSEIYGLPHPIQKIVTYELGAVLLLWIIRAWRLSKAATWLQKLWAQFWVGALFWLVSLFMVPVLAWGTPYKTALGQIVKAIFRHFL